MRSLAGRAIFLLSVSLLIADSASAAACPSRTWVAGQEIELDNYSQRVVPIDVDGDGILDLAASLDEPPSKVVTMRGVGDGTFAAPVTLFTSPDTLITGSITDMAAADVNGDGYQDLLVANLGDFLIYRGSATGLGAPATTFLDYWMSDFTVGNFDADAALEMVASSASPSQFSVYDNVDGWFTETRQVSSSGDGFNSHIASADFDGDSHFDVAVSHRVDDETGEVHLYFRNANGTFAAPLVLAAGSFPREIAAADFDGDGLPDLATINWYDNSVTVYMNGGSRQFTSSTLDAAYPGGFGDAASLVVADVDQDGATDILVGSVNSGAVLATFIGIGDGTFRSPTYFTSSGGQFNRFIDALALGDFDGDGDLDLAVAASTTMVIASPACATQVTLTTQSPLISTTAEATLNVTIAGFGGTMPNPIGTVTLREGTTTVGTASPNAAGQVSFVVPPMSAGDHTFTAEFSGNALLSGATSNAATQKVTASQTTTTVYPPETQPVYGTTWPLQIVVEGVGFGDEWVTVFVDGVPREHYTSNPLELGLTPGPHAIYAKFKGTVLRPASTSATLHVTVLKATPVVAVGGASTVRQGQAHALQVTVPAPAGTVTPTGSVQFLNGNTAVGAGTLSGGAVNANVTLPRGSYDVRVVYSGDANFNSVETTVTLHVLANQPLAINARGLASAMHISYVVPEGTTSMTLYRRAAGGAWETATGWNNSTGLDSFSATRGVVYEYQLHTVTNGVAMQSNIDGALLFTDDPITAGATRVKRAHFTEMRDAVNLLRAAAGLTPFAFNATFTASNIVRAEHLLALQTAAAEARSALGMTAAAFDAFGPGSAISAAHVRQTRDAIR